MAYIGRSLQAGSFRQLDDISSSFNGSTTAFTMQVNSTNVSMGDVNQIQLSLGGVIQKPGTDFTISGSTLTFTTAPAANTSFFAILLGSDNGGTVTPTDGSVTTDKFASNATLTTTGTVTTQGTGTTGGTITLENTDTSGSNGDFLGKINFKGNDSSSGASGTRAAIEAKVVSNFGSTELHFKTAGSGASATDAMVIDSAGHVTKPLQSAFQATPSGTQSNIATSSNVQIEFGTERFDVNGDFASHTFTAPVTGKYQLNAQLRFQSVDTAADYYQLRLATSNRTYGPLIDPGPFGSDPEYWNISFSVVADMDANDTAIVSLRQQGGTQQTDIDDASHFSGCLLA